jgi:hemolysin activation/secretion protein
LGGSRTLRGILLNRVVGDGFALGNVELRWKFVHFNIGSTNVYLGLNGFVDAGMVTSKIDLDMSALEQGERQLFFSNENEKPHVAAGLGLRIAINRNFIVAVDYGKAFDDRDGSTGMYIGLNYLF